LTARRPTVLVAMSGGVDSSVAAARLAEQGYEVVGATLKLWCYDEREPARRPCCSLEAIADARSVALRMGFTHHVLDYTADFRARIAEPFVAGYLAGRTPYPCAACNADLKFGRLLEQARGIGAAFVATGHYARRAPAPLAGGGEEPALWRAVGRAKDQSYALWGVARASLPSLLFPLGGLTKDEVRAHAERLGLARVADKHESQDLCFVGPGGYAAFLAEAAGRERVERPGPILDLEGRELGEHGGLAHYTVGQRRGLGRGVAGGGALYVVALDAERNAVTVGPEAALLAREARTGPLNWLPADPPQAGRRLQAQIRYRAGAADATLWPGEAGSGRAAADPDTAAPFDPAAGARIVFDAPQRAVTPGQSAVLYDGDRLLGGGTIL
jgi:tRNA-specific 2-thiouridylase